jgi:hypothetical protein
MSGWIFAPAHDLAANESHFAQLLVIPQPSAEKEHRFEVMIARQIHGDAVYPDIMLDFEVRLATYHRCNR